MNEVIDGLLYTRSHEWVQIIEGNKARMGVTDHAQHELGDIVYIELPAVGSEVAKGSEAGALESVKTVEPFYSPLGGVISSVNQELDSQPELINQSPYGDGWLMEIESFNEDDTKDLLDSKAYAQYLQDI